MYEMLPHREGCLAEHQRGSFGLCHGSGLWIAQPSSAETPAKAEKVTKSLLLITSNEAGSYLEIGGRRLGPFYTFGEISLKNRASWIRYEMGELHDRVMKVK